MCTRRQRKEANKNLKLYTAYGIKNEDKIEGFFFFLSFKKTKMDLRESNSGISSTKTLGGKIEYNMGEFYVLGGLWGRSWPKLLCSEGGESHNRLGNGCTTQDKSVWYQKILEWGGEGVLTSLDLLRKTHGRLDI